jgi:hypothetical protein
MSDEYDKVIYQEDSRLLSWLMVRQCAELLGEDAEENLELMTDEEEQWVRAVAKYGKDEQVFTFIKPHSEIAEVGTSTYDNTPEDEPKASDWVTSETVRPEKKLNIVQKVSSDCGKPLHECTGPRYGIGYCNHVTETVSSELVDDIRQEFKEDWNSMHIDGMCIVEQNKGETGFRGSSLSKQVCIATRHRVRWRSRGGMFKRNLHRTRTT